MSKEFQRIKERDDVRKQLFEFIANSIPRAVRDYPICYQSYFSIPRLDMSIV